MRAPAYHSTDPLDIREIHRQATILREYQQRYNRGDPLPDDDVFASPYTIFDDTISSSERFGEYTAHVKNHARRSMRAGRMRKELIF